tara:strand:- start:162 stop:305 length:144 start_codon:yes stop_codon:yes gene_type:complete
MYPSLDPENYPGTPEYQEKLEREAQRRQAQHDLQIDEYETERYYCRR